ERFASDGATVLAVDLDAERGTETVHRIDVAGGRAEFGRFDLSEPGSVEAMIAWAVEHYGGIDVLVNNAGGGAGVGAAYPDVEPEAWLGTLEVNLVAPMRAIQAV